MGGKKIIGNESKDVAPEKCIATCQAFFPLGEGDGREPWHVIVTQAEDNALAPVSKLSNQISDTGAVALAGFVGVTALLWVGVIRALRRL